MRKYLICLVLATGCTHLPSSPEELRAATGPSVSTQEALLPNTTYEQMFQRVKQYAEKCLRITRTVPCGAKCVPTTVRFTPTVLTEKNKITLLLQKESGGDLGKVPANGFYIMMAEVQRNGGVQQLIIHGVDGGITQTTMDWLAGRGRVCPAL